MKLIKFTKSFGRFYENFNIGYSIYRGLSFETELIVHFACFNMVIGFGKGIDWTDKGLKNENTSN